MLRSNYFEITLNTQSALFKYSVTITPDVKKGGKRRHFFNDMLEEIEELQALDHGVATDYGGFLITSTRLNAANRLEFNMAYHKGNY